MDLEDFYVTLLDTLGLSCSLEADCDQGKIGVGDCFLMILSSEQDTLQAKGEQGLSVLFLVPIFALCSHCFNGHCGYDLACKYRSRVFSSLECCGHLKSVCHVLSQDQSQRRLNTINRMRCVSTFAHLFQLSELSWYFVQPICCKMGLHSGCLVAAEPRF